MEWTESKTYELIEYRQSCPCLFDIRSDDYHNRVVKNRAWDELSKKFATTGMYATVNSSVSYFYCVYIVSVDGCQQRGPLAE